MTLETVMINSTYILGAIGVLAFLVNVVIELTKDIVRLPTKLWVIIVSLVINLAMVILLVSLKYVEFKAYIIILAVLGSFIVAYISMYGWDTLKELWNRYKK